MIVSDASLVVDFLIDEGKRGTWATAQIASARRTCDAAAYVALAQALAVPMVTIDRRLSRAGGHGVDVHAFGD